MISCSKNSSQHENYSLIDYIEYEIPIFSLFSCCICSWGNETKGQKGYKRNGYEIIVTTPTMAELNGFNNLYACAMDLNHLCL